MVLNVCTIAGQADFIHNALRPRIEQRGGLSLREFVEIIAGAALNGIARGIIYQAPVLERERLTTYVQRRIEEYLADSLDFYSTEQFKRLLPPELR